MSVAVCITTRNRRDIFEATLIEHLKYLPEDATLYIIDDASREPLDVATFRFRANVGIARAKNKCLELAHKCDHEHIFLFDDDCFPLQWGWEQPYIASSQGHLMFCWENSPRSQATIEAEYDGLKAYSRGRGPMLYIRRDVLELAGGLNPNFGPWGYEHYDWSKRIYNMGFTKHPFQDVEDSQELLDCLDLHQDGLSTVKVPAQQRFLRKYRSEYLRSIESTDRYDWRTNARYSDDMA